MDSNHFYYAPPHILSFHYLKNSYFYSKYFSDDLLIPRTLQVLSFGGE